MLCAESPHNVNDLVSKTPHKYLGTAASAMSHLGANGVYPERVCRASRCSS